jgi:UDP-N-acetylglucosamine 2-epimerase (non-hydrolysing)
MSMPEEINRKLTDQLSTIHFVTSPEAVTHLEQEGVKKDSIHFVGNTMIDTLYSVRQKLQSESIRSSLGVERPFVLATLHRPANVDDAEAAHRAVLILQQASRRARVILPLHPRGRKSLVDAGLLELSNVTISEPLTYLEFTALLSDAEAVITDSGGVQEESTMLGTPCLTLRPNTERPVTISQGTNRLVTSESFAVALDEALAAGRPQEWPTPDLWDGKSGKRVADIIVAWLGRR